MTSIDQLRAATESAANEALEQGQITEWHFQQMVDGVVSTYDLDVAKQLIAQNAGWYDLSQTAHELSEAIVAQLDGQGTLTTLVEDIKDFLVRLFGDTPALPDPRPIVEMGPQAPAGEISWHIEPNLTPAEKQEIVNLIQLSTTADGSGATIYFYEGNYPGGKNPDAQPVFGLSPDQALIFGDTQSTMPLDTLWEKGHTLVVNQLVPPSVQSKLEYCNQVMDNLQPTTALPAGFIGDNQPHTMGGPGPARDVYVAINPQPMDTPMGPTYQFFLTTDPPSSPSRQYFGPFDDLPPTA